MENTTFFSFYDVLEKIAIIVGTFVFALFIDKYDSLRAIFAKIDVTLPSASGMRFAAFSMALFFFVGLILIRFLKLNTQKK